MGQRISYTGQPLSGANNPIYRNLVSGAYHLLPAGQFAVDLGRQIAIQFFNVNNNTWNILCVGPTTTPVTITSDGINYRIINLSGTIMGASVTNQGSGTYVQSTTSLSFGSAPTGGVAATGVAIVGGDLTLTVTAGGSNYSPLTYLVIQPPWVAGGQNSVGSLPAIAIPTITSGAVASTTFTGGFAGAGYGTVPTVTVVDPTGVGSGAVVTAAIGTTNAALITGILITNGGSNYTGTTIPTVTITGAGSSAAATAIPSMALKSITVSSGGAVLTNAYLQTDGGTVVTSLNGESTTYRPATASATTSAGIITAAVIEDEGAGFQSVPKVGYINTGAIATTAPTLVAVVGGVNSLYRSWQFA